MNIITRTKAPDIDLGISQMDSYYDPDWRIMYDPQDSFACVKPWTNSVVRMYNEIRGLGLERNIVDLEVFGYTIVEPEKVGSPELADRLAKAIVTVAEKRTGQSISVERG